MRVLDSSSLTVSGGSRRVESPELINQNHLSSLNESFELSKLEFASKVATPDFTPISVGWIKGSTKQKDSNQTSLLTAQFDSRLLQLFVWRLGSVFAIVFYCSLIPSCRWDHQEFRSVCGATIALGHTISWPESGFSTDLFSGRS